MKLKGRREGMITSYDEFVRYLKEDGEAMKSKVMFPKFYHWMGLGDKIWFFLYLTRRLEYLHNTKNGMLWKLPYLFYKYIRYRVALQLDFSIPINTLGSGVSIPHRGTIVINSGARLGKGCRIHVCTNIGAFKGGAPKIGDGVYIGPGAKIFGDITIGDNISIGANAVVNKSFMTPNISIAGVPAKQIASVNT